MTKLTFSTEQLPFCGHLMAELSILCAVYQHKIFKHMLHLTTHFDVENQSLTVITAEWQFTVSHFYFFPKRNVKYYVCVCLSCVCVSTFCLSASISQKNLMSKLHTIFIAYCPWPCLDDLPLTTMQYDIKWGFVDDVIFSLFQIIGHKARVLSMPTWVPCCSK